MEEQARNKGGRPKGSHRMAEIAQRYTIECIQTWVSIMRNTKAADRDRIAAADLLMKRAWGNVPQAVTGEGGGPIQIQMMPGDDAL